MGKPNETLHRLHDGELPAEERAILERELDDGDRLRLAALADVGAAVRHTLEAETRSIDVWASVAARIQPGAAAPAPAADGAAPAADGASTHHPERGQVIPFRRRVIKAMRNHRVIVPALAAAAAFVLWMSSGRDVLTNACDIESLEVGGGAATVLKVHDRTDSTTVIWMTED